MTLSLPSVKLEHFEGPFDLLIDLARKRKLDLSEVSLKQITDDFLRYLNERKVPAAAQGDFLVVASTLLLLKVRHLLPSLSPEEEEEVQDLTDRLWAYQMYRERAEYLRDRWGSRRLLPVGFWSEQGSTSEPSPLPEVQLQDLEANMDRLIAQLPKPLHARAHLTTRGRTLQECLSHFRRRLAQVKRFVFQDAVSGVNEKERAVSFLAVLEMAKDGEYSLEQDGLFNPLTVSRVTKKR